MIPPGWRLAPETITPEMVSAWKNASDFYDGYRKALAASPPPPEVGDERSISSDGLLATTVSAGQGTAALAPEREWRALSIIPEDGELVEGKLSDGSITEAEYWCGPDERPDWGGWAWDGTAQFAGANDPNVELIAWRPFDDGALAPRAEADDATGDTP